MKRWRCGGCLQPSNRHGTATQVNEINDLGAVRRGHLLARGGFPAARIRRPWLWTWAVVTGMLLGVVDAWRRRA